MANVQFNKVGVPLIGYGSRGVYLSTMGGPEEKPKKIATLNERIKDVEKDITFNL